MKQPSFYRITFLFLITVLISGTAVADYSKSFEGYQVFNTYCFICHGKNGKGDGPLAGKIDIKPTDLTDDKLMRKRSDKELKRIVEGSSPHGSTDKTKQPRWGVAISHTQVRSLVSYIRYLHRGKHELPGNPVSGKEVYDNYCIQCHGPYGEGDGVLTRVYKMEPANYTDASDMNKFSNSKLYSFISKGGTGSSLMPAWKNVLTEKEINDVISYIRLIAAH